MTIAAVLGTKGHNVETITADAPLLDAVRRLGEKRIGALPVVEDGRIVGIISERDVIYCLRDQGASALEGPVSQVMTAPASAKADAFMKSRSMTNTPIAPSTRPARIEPPPITSSP